MAFEIPKDLMVSVSGVRGRVGEALNTEVVAHFAAAYGSWLKATTGKSRPRVVLGRDSRTSGPMFSRAAGAALQSVGCDVIDIHLAPTPTTLFSIHCEDADGAIVVTASHNPVQWNALKLASSVGMFLDGEQAAEMRRYLAELPIAYAAWDVLGRVSPREDAIQRHVDAILGIPFLDVEEIRARHFNVALDCISGAGTVFLPRLLEALGCRVHGINMEPHGRFHRPPEPVAENLAELEEHVRFSHADIGMATDPDADRLSLVDEKGHAIGEDFTLALATRLVLRHRTGPVVTNLSTSRVLEDICEEHGITLDRAPVGEINVARRMEAVGAVVGGEGNGGVILPDVHLTRDSGVAAALVLQLMLETGKTPSQLVGDQRQYSIVKDKLPRDAGELSTAFATLERELGAPLVDTQDGLRLAWPDEAKWLHLRASGTEPILRIIAEAPSREGALQLVEQARKALAAE